jgi:hypothetical protein
VAVSFCTLLPSYIQPKTNRNFHESLVFFFTEKRDGFRLYGSILTNKQYSSMETKKRPQDFKSLAMEDLSYDDKVYRKKVRHTHGKSYKKAM